MKSSEQGSQFLIPEKLKVGFQKRDGTYSGLLAYVIYIDNTGKVRKERSWENWRDKNIEVKELVNDATEGFVLNKKVGGHKSSWNYRDAHVRVYDPRGFEFEISVPNLLFILREGTCHPGKGLEGKFVYAWEGTELVLLPTHSQDYKNSISFTELQSTNVKVRDLLPGVTYITKDQKELIFLGKMDYYFATDYSYRSKDKNKGCVKKFVFSDSSGCFYYLNDSKTISKQKDETVHPEYAELVDKYNKSIHASKIVKLFLKEKKGGYFKEENGIIKNDYGFYERVYKLDEKTGRVSDNYGQYHYNPNKIETHLGLFAETSNGSIHEIN